VGENPSTVNTASHRFCPLLDESAPIADASSCMGSVSSGSVQHLCPMAAPG